MNPHGRTPQRPSEDEPARKPDSIATSSTGESGSDDTEARRQAAAHARSSAAAQSRSDAALGDADAARGRAAEAEGQGDTATAGAEWSDAAGLDGLAAHEATTSAIDARAAAAAAQSTTVPAGQQNRRRAGRKNAPAPSGKGPVRAPTPPPGAARNIA
ncbi:hypothetical protein ACIOEX_02485 [Streptomyces sp. NPDC087850]|uniref:hypothetical protein n=1 Tax=Streptomyces sp. NPDC087850 TaxID=3365809 RepID=UPI0037FA6F74